MLRLVITLSIQPVSDFQRAIYNRPLHFSLNIYSCVYAYLSLEAFLLFRNVSYSYNLLSLIFNKLLCSDYTV